MKLFSNCFLFSVISEARNWDVFRLLPPPGDNLKKSFLMTAALQVICFAKEHHTKKPFQVLKLGTILAVTGLTLISAYVAKTSFLLMTSAIAWGDKNVTICHTEWLQIGRQKSL